MIKKIISITILGILSSSSIANEYLLSICNDHSYIQFRGDRLFLPNTELAYSGRNYCLYDGGKDKVKGMYKHGNKHGVWSTWFENGKLKNTITYKDGLYDGLSEHYYEDGQKKESLMWVDNKKNGQMMQWFNTTQKRNLRNYKDDLEHGEFKDWAENGQIITHGYKKDGIYHGMYTRWFNNLYNKKRTEHNIVDGLIDGVLINWFESGKVSEKRTYKMGVLDGFTTVFYDIGEPEDQVKSRIKFNNKGEVVSFIGFFEDGEIKDITGNKNKREGVWYWKYKSIDAFMKATKDSLFLNEKDVLKIKEERYTHLNKSQTVSKISDAHIFLNDDESIVTIAIYDNRDIHEVARLFYDKVVSKGDSEDKTLEYYEKAYKINPKDSKLLVAYASALISKNDNQLGGKPMELIKQALQIDPYSPDALYLAGIFAVSEQEFELAKGLWKKALSRLPEGSDDREDLLNILEELNSNEDIIKKR